MLEIREMVLEDLDQVEAIEQACFSVPWSKKGFEDSMKQEYTLYLVCSAEGRIAGYCGYFQSFEEADITNVAVAEAFRSRGIGKRLLEELMNRGAKRGVAAYTLEVRVSNTQARRLYEKLGFEEAGVRKQFYEKPKEDAVIMWKRR